MMSVIRCKQCGDDLSSFNKTTVTVEYTTSRKSCNHCNKIKTEKECNYFCSVKCFEEYYIHDTQLAIKKPTPLEEWNKTV